MNSAVIGRWIDHVQNVMPDEMRNSDLWKNLLSEAAKTGRDHERKRLTIIMDWMWGTVLPTLQPLADTQGFGAAWRQMTTKRSVKVAKTAWKEAKGEAAWAARAAADAAGLAAAARRLSMMERMVDEAMWKTVDVAWQTMVASPAPVREVWATLDPCALLQKLIEM